MAGLPFFMTMDLGFLISTLVLHFMQYASMPVLLSLWSVRSKVADKPRGVNEGHCVPGCQNVGLCTLPGRVWMAGERPGTRAEQG